MLQYFYLLEELHSTVSWDPTLYMAIAPEISQEPDFIDPVTAIGSNRRQALDRAKHRIQV